MNRWRVPAVGICVCFLVVVALLTILFVVMNKHPESRIDLSSTDMRLVERVSSVWCGSQEISSVHLFTAYRIAGEPARERSPSSSHRLNYSLKLRWGKETELKYYLLPGASMQIQACSDRPGVILRIFQPVRKWRECRRLRKKPFHQHDGDSSSSEESDEVESRVKGLLDGVLSRHPWYPPDCKEAMQSHEVPSGRRSECSKRSSFSLTANSESTYVFSFEDYHNAADESNTEVKLVLNRTRYHTENAMVVCQDVTACEVPLSFGSDERSVVAAREEVNAGAVTYGVVAKCKPRVFFFVFLFAFIPLLLLFCIGCIICCFQKRKSRSKTTVKYIQVPQSAPNSPLLSGPDITIYSRTEGYSRPPAYPDSTAPPPYAPYQVAPPERSKDGGNGQ